MTKVKVFVYGRRRRHRRGYGNSSPDFRHGELKSLTTASLLKQLMELKYVWSYTITSW